MARHLITSAIPYINGIKHLGNLVGSQLPADLYARYLRQRGHEVLFLCATDEHGTPAELAGLIREVTEEQVYSNADGRFLPDRYIEGTCPNCGFDSLRCAKPNICICANPLSKTRLPRGSTAKPIGRS